MNDLQRYFEANTRNLIDKHTHYFEIYERYFAKYRGTEVTFVEIGIFHGGSLQMWKNYFGPKARIYGVDINPDCKKFEEDQIKIFIGDQSDKRFLESLTKQIPRPDIFLDDGGHFMDQQINTFEVCYPWVLPNGIYMCEDMHTSYWLNYGGGFRSRGTFVEYSKYFIDYLNARHCPKLQQRHHVEDFRQSAYSVHFYDSILVVEKKPLVESERQTTGTPMFPLVPQRTFAEKVKFRLREYVGIARHKLTYRPYHRG